VDSSQQAEAPPASNWADETIKNWFGLKLGEQAWMLNKWQQQQEVVMDDIRRARDPSGATSGDAQEGDVAGVNVGNTIHNHYSSSSQTAAATDNTQTTTSPASVAKAGLSTAAKAAIAAALLGTGSMGGAGGLALLQWLTKPTVNVTAPAGIDTNAAIELGE